MSVIVLGADGYIGWALTCRLAVEYHGPIVLVDDLSKRRRVTELGGESAVPIASFEQRVDALRRCTSRMDIVGVVSPVTECIEDLVRDVAPSTIVHLAQIPSAPYSMMSARTAIETMSNNEAANLAVLFAMRDHAPNAHLVKMGSMGEYLNCGVPITEGYVDAVLNGVPTAGPIPFPRGARDVYHITKINDTNFIAMACSVWGLAVTDVMQSVVYGVGTSLSPVSPAFNTRFDCDPVFGSVLNRFVSQAISGVPLTVYGGGHATTGLISLRDSIDALQTWINTPAAPGAHRVINQATHTRKTILELALIVRKCCREWGIDVALDFQHDPRHEQGECSEPCEVESQSLRDAGIGGESLEHEIAALIDDVMNATTNLEACANAPGIDWTSGLDSAPTHNHLRVAALP